MADAFAARQPGILVTGAEDGARNVRGASDVLESEEVAHEKDYPD